jgi:2,3-bisphosphoglycerate-independent phosphoglycerate mutase
VFLDGVGIGPADSAINPFLRAELPTLRGALGGRIPTLSEPQLRGAGGFAFPLDARLGVSGLPQSGTGQVALLTGAPAPALLGHHMGPWVPVRLRALLDRENLLSRIRDEGGSAQFANAYPAGWPGPLPTRRQAAPPLAARAAGLLTLHEEALVRGDAVAAEIVNDGWQRYRPQFTFPAVDEQTAGATLARLASEADFTLFAHFSTDTVGHRGSMADAVAALERVDRFLAGILGAPTNRPLAVLVASDHGNLEVVGEGHTLNPALGLALAPRCEWGGGLSRVHDCLARLAEARSLTHVAPLVREAIRAIHPP